MSLANILLLEDDRDIAELVSDWLRRHNHQVDVLSSGESAIAALASNIEKYACLIVDVMLPGKSGTEVCDWFRMNHGTAPILMLTAKDAIEDKEKAFRLGADDYMTKPFQLRELSVRVEALLRRASGSIGANCLTVGKLALYPQNRTANYAGKEVQLSPTEFRLLELLVRNPNRTFSSAEILNRAWDPVSDAMDETVRGHITRLRKKLDLQGKPSIIRNVYGFGYKLETGE